MAHPIVDESLGKDCPKELLLQKHLKFLVRCKSENDSTLDYCRMSGIYWVLTALDLLDSLSEVDGDEIVDFVLSCQKKCGGFAPCPKHDAHLLSTLSAIQILAMYDCLNKVNVEAVCAFVSKLQMTDCSSSQIFLKGMWRIFGTTSMSDFSASAAMLFDSTILLPGKSIHFRYLFNGKSSKWLKNGIKSYDVVNSANLNTFQAHWSWWTVATLAIFGRLTWIKQTDLTRFILASQDDQTGGIADKPGNIPDPFHTLFGLAGLSLLAQVDSYFSSPKKMENGLNGVEDPAFVALQTARNKLKTINPVLCMPQYIIDRLQLKFQLL